MKNTFILFFLSAALLSGGCRKTTEQPFLRFNQQSITVAPVSGTTIDVVIESNVSWRLTMDANWLQFSKTSGNGKDTVHITVTNDNTGNGVRSVLISASAENSSTLKAQLSIEQRSYNLQLLGRKMIGGSNAEYVSGIVSTADGGHIVVGYTNSSNSGDVRASNGNIDYWVVRLNSNNDTLWTRVLGGSSNDIAEAVAATPDGGFVVAGYTFDGASGDVPAGHGSADMWVVKLTATAEIAWSNRFGGSFYDAAYAISVAADGGIVVGGTTTSASIDGDLGSYHGGDGDVLVIKLTAAGQLAWAHTLGGSGYDAANDIMTTDGGDVVVVGVTASNDGDITGTNRGGDGDVWIVRLKSNGEKIWTRILGGTGYDELYAISPATDGGFVGVGYTNSDNSFDIGETKGMYDVLVVKLRSNGNWEWTSVLGGSEDEIGYAITASPDGGHIIAGKSDSNDGDVATNKGGSDFFLTKLNKSGQKVWATTFGGSSNDYAGGVVRKPDGTFTIAGTSRSSNSGDVNTTNRGLVDWWIVNMKDQ